MENTPLKKQESDTRRMVSESAQGNEESDKNELIQAAHDNFVLHIVMIISALLLVIIAMILHFFKPDDQFYITVGVAAIGFLFGKFTNNFGGRRRKGRENE